jgi:hypothetical protein
MQKVIFKTTAFFTLAILYLDIAIVDALEQLALFGIDIAIAAESAMLFEQNVYTVIRSFSAYEFVLFTYRQRASAQTCRDGKIQRYSFGFHFNLIQS